jgi:hypothetical protein
MVMDVEPILNSNLALGCVLLLIAVLIGRANRPFLRDVAHDPDAIWRVLARAALAAVTALLVWGSVFDNWRQLVGAPFRMAQRFPSQRVEYDPPSHAVRSVTVVLLGIALLFVACLVARHVAGYLLQFVFAVGALILWVPLFAIRQRLDVNLAFGFDGSWTSPLDVLGYLLFVVLAWLFEIALMVLLFGIALAIVAIPVTLCLDLLRLRRPRTTTEAAAFFGSFSQRAGAAGRPGSPPV